MDFLSLRALNYATGFCLIIRELVPSKVGEERFSPWGDYIHDFVGRWCYLGARTPDYIRAMFGIWGYGRILNCVATIVLPHYGWLEEPLHKGVRWDGVAFGAHSRKDVRCLITFFRNMMKLEPLEPELIF